MKTKLMAAVAVMAVLTATGAARADDAADVAALKAQAATLKKQNEQLEQRLNKIEQQQAALPQSAGARSFMAADLPGIKDAIPTCALPPLDGPLTFCGITVFGTIDAGLGWASYGLPTNSKFYLGDSLINKNANRSYFGVAPSGLSQSTLGVKGSYEILPGISGVFWASTGINPQSGQLANAPGSIVDNNGLNRNAYSNNGDGSRGGQPFNDQLYVGLSSKTYGQLTFGRHKSLTNDMVGAYDPAGGAYAFSVIGYSGTPVAGLGDTGNARWDDSFKYKVEFPVNGGFTGRFGAIYKFADGNGGCNYLGTGVAPVGTVQQCYSTKNDAGQVGAGFTYAGFDFDAALGYFHQAVSFGPLSAAQAFGGVSTFVPTYGPTINSVGANAGTLAGTISDNTGWALAGKYTYQNWKFFAGWAHVIYHNPENSVGIGAQGDQGGYILSSVNNAAFPHAKLLDTFWTGTKYAYNDKTDIVGSFYVEAQNGYGTAANLSTCSLPAYLPYGSFGAKINGTVYGAQSAPRSGACSGNLYGASAYVDYHFTKRFDIYGGLMYSAVTGGIQSGYFSASNWAPTVGARLTF
ncbi:porin [Rhodoblastus sp.]|uniref:porin n=1 Tax=Rhodoblastus sp. TaxID=1962975 RepID=UPI0035AEFF07